MHIDLKLIEAIVNTFRTVGATSEALGIASKSLGGSAPLDYVALVSKANGFEGFIGNEYFRLYPVDQLPEINKSCKVLDFMPGITIIGDNGIGEAYAYDLRSPSHPIIQIPFIPLDSSKARQVAVSITELLLGYVGPRSLGSALSAPKADHLAKVVHNIKPIIFGGSPTDPSNKIVIPLAKYFEAVVWWNQQYLIAKGGQPK